MEILMTLRFFPTDELVCVFAGMMSSPVRADSILVAKCSLSVLPSNLLPFVLPFNLLLPLWSLDNKQINLHAL